MEELAHCPSGRKVRLTKELHVSPHKKTSKVKVYGFFSLVGWVLICLAVGVDAAKDESGSTDYA